MAVEITMDSKGDWKRLVFRGKKQMYFVMFDWVCLNRPQPFIFIGWEGLYPWEVKNMLQTDLESNYNSNSDQSAKNRSDRSPNPVRPDSSCCTAAKTGQTGPQIRSDRFCPDRRTSWRHNSYTRTPNQVIHMSVSIVSTRASSWCIKTHDLTSS